MENKKKKRQIMLIQHLIKIINPSLKPFALEMLCLHSRAHSRDFQEERGMKCSQFSKLKIFTSAN